MRNAVSRRRVNACMRIIALAVVHASGDIVLVGLVESAMILLESRVTQDGLKEVAAYR